MKQTLFSQLQRPPPPPSKQCIRSSMFTVNGMQFKHYGYLLTIQRGDLKCFSPKLYELCELIASRIF